MAPRSSSSASLPSLSHVLSSPSTSLPRPGSQSITADRCKPQSTPAPISRICKGTNSGWSPPLIGRTARRPGHQSLAPRTLPLPRISYPQLCISALHKLPKRAGRWRMQTRSWSAWLELAVWRTDVQLCLTLMSELVCDETGIWLSACGGCDGG